MKSISPSPDLLVMLRLAQNAARAIMAVYASDFAVRAKADLSPVTEADEKAERIILAGLARHFAHVPVIAEEAAAAGRIPDVATSFFLVDPLDGTKEFLSRNGEFTVNIAWIENGKPVAGVVYAPAKRQIFWGAIGIGAGFGAVAPEDELAGFTWQPIAVRKPASGGLTVLASRSHLDPETENYLSGLAIKKRVSAGSSLKFCLVAKGEADLYPRFGRTMEWDTAAGQAVLEAAGGKVLLTDGTPLTYGKCDQGFVNPAFIASA